MQRLCVPACAEGALKIIDGKARLISETYCDGLGACLGHCPQDAIIIEEREAGAFDEEVVQAHLHRATAGGPLAHTGPDCPSSATQSWDRNVATEQAVESALPEESELSQWPVKLTLVNPQAPYFQDTHLIVVADCVPIAYRNFHQNFLKGKSVVIGCPKLDDVSFYRDKLAQILQTSSVRSLHVVHMEVPCGFGLRWLAGEAKAASGKDLPLEETVISIHGERQSPSET